MAQKNATHKKAQAAILKRNKLNPLFWVVAQDLGNHLVFRHWITGEFRAIRK